MNILVLILCQTLSWRFLHVLSQLSIIHTLCPLILFSNYPPKLACHLPTSCTEKPWEAGPLYTDIPTSPCPYQNFVTFLSTYSWAEEKKTLHSSQREKKKQTNTQKTQSQCLSAFSWYTSFKTPGVFCLYKEGHSSV